MKKRLIISLLLLLSFKLLKKTLSIILKKQKQQQQQQKCRFDASKSMLFKMQQRIRNINTIKQLLPQRNKRKKRIQQKKYPQL